MIGVIGCGNMGSALIKGMLQKHFRASSELIAWDSDAARLNRVVKSYKIRKAHSNVDLAKRSHLILLAVKPQQIYQVCDEIRPYLTARQIIVSIAAGIPTRRMKEHIGKSVPVVRVMPNTPALIGHGVSAVSTGSEEMVLRVVEMLFQSVGEVVRVPERYMDAVTAISGSGPAYFFFLMEQMMKEARKLGLSPSVAHQLVLKTAEGASALAMHTGADPAVLRTNVTSKGGTTEAAFKVFEEKKFGEILREGIRAAHKRAKELAR